MPVTDDQGRGGSLARLMAIYLACALPALLFAGFHLRDEHPLYIWDYSLYWGFFKALGAKCAAGGLGCLAIVQHTIAFDDYNVAAVVPLLPVYMGLGGSRLVYVGALVALYLVPAALVAARLALGEASSGRADKVLAVCAALAFPVFWDSALRGMVDVIGLIPLGLATILLLRTRWLSQASPRQALGFGLLIWLTFLFRRWYAFSLVALIVMAAGACALRLLARRPFPTADARRAATLYVWAGCGCLAPAFALQTPLLLRILHSNYAEAYAAYQTGALAQLQAYAAAFGALTLAVAALGLGADLARRKFDSLFCLMVAGFTALLFARVQAPGPQHFLPVALLLFPAFFSGLAFVTGKKPTLTRPLAAVLIAANFFSTFLPPGGPMLEAARALFPQSRFAPLRSAHFAEYQRLTADLRRLSPPARVAVFASALALSDSLLAAIDPALAPRLVWAAQVDLRDHFFWDVLAADYFVTGTPTPLHLPPSGQRVIALPADDIEQGTGIGAGLRDLGQVYELDAGVSARIHQRMRPLTHDEIAALAERFYGFYPGWRGQDRASAGMLLATATLTPTEAAERVKRRDDHALAVDLAGGPLRLAFANGELFAARRLEAGLDFSRCAAPGEATLTLAAEGQMPETHRLQGDSTFAAPLPETGRLTLDIEAVGAAACGRAVLVFGP